MRVTEALDSGPWALQTSFSVGLRDDAGSHRPGARLPGRARASTRCSPAWTTGRWSGPSSRGARATPRSSGLEGLPARLRPACTGRARPGALSQPPGGSTGCRAETSSSRCGAPGPTASRDSSRCRRSGRGRRPAGRWSRSAGEQLVRRDAPRACVEVLSVQPDGKSTMTAAAFLRGYGARLGRRIERAERRAASPACRGDVETEREAARARTDSRIPGTASAPVHPLG